jgi:hypothetical protein
MLSGICLVTQEGKQWISNLYAHVFTEEHRGEFAAHGATN